MKRIAVAALAAAVFSASTFADEYVQGYFKKDGTYVQPHTRSSPNANRYDNYGSQSFGGSQRDEFSKRGATNKTNQAYGAYDNDADGLYNSYDPAPESKCNSDFGC